MAPGDKRTPFLKIKDAATETGLSQFYIRNGCKNGSIPCIRTGRTYYVNVQLLLEKLNKESESKNR